MATALQFESLMNKPNEQPDDNLKTNLDDEHSLLSAEIENFKEECNEFSFLTVGKTGVGKSTLLNALTDTNVFKSSGDRSTAETKIVSHYKFKRNGVQITAWDSPGFEDCSGNEEEYKTELKKNCSDVDLVLFCISLKDTRDHLKEKNSSLLQITDALSAEVWRKSLVVLTYANILESRIKLDKKIEKDFDKKVEEWKKKVQDGLKDASVDEEIIKQIQILNEAFDKKVEEWKKKVQDGLKHASVDEEIIKQIQIVAAGHCKKKHILGCRFWLSYLWIKMLQTAKTEQAKLAFQKANQDRLVTEEDGETSSPTSIVVTKDYLAMAAGGGVGLTGAAIGGTTGALIGALAIGIPTFGLAAGVGLVLGLGIGGTIGGGAGTGVYALIKNIREKIRKKKERQC